MAGRGHFSMYGLFSFSFPLVMALVAGTHANVAINSQLRISTSFILLPSAKSSLVSSEGVHMKDVVSCWSVIIWKKCSVLIVDCNSDVPLRALQDRTGRAGRYLCNVYLYNLYLCNVYLSIWEHYRTERDGAELGGNVAPSFTASLDTTSISPYPLFHTSLLLFSSLTNVLAPPINKPGPLSPNPPEYRLIKYFLPRILFILLHHLQTLWRLFLCVN